MDIRDRRGLKQWAAQRLDQANNAQRLVLIWAAASAGISLLASFLSFLLESQIELTGGLSGIGLRSVLTTIQSLLSMATVVLIPFWNLGYMACTLKFTRGQRAENATLLTGFRRFGPALRMQVLRYVLMGAISFAVMYMGISILSLTPLGAPMLEVISGQEEAILTGTASDELMLAASESMMPLLAGAGVICFLVLIPVIYRLRLADFRVVDEPRCGARASLRESTRLMGRHGWSLVALDLSFWWYYLGMIVATALCYGDLILAGLGVELPFGTDAAFFIFYVIGLLAQVVLRYFKGNYVQTTYAVFYDALRAQYQPVQKPAPQDAEPNDVNEL